MKIQKKKKHFFELFKKKKKKIDLVNKASKCQRREGEE